MSAGKKTARFAHVDALPAHLRAQARAQLEKIPVPLSPVPLAGDAPIDDAREAALPVDNSVESGDKSRRSKYGAVPTVVDGIRFDSKREARYYMVLKGQQAEGHVRYFLRQVPIHLPGGTKLVVDFVVFYALGGVRYIDVKGHETAAFKIKRREVEHHYPIRIELA